MIIEHRSRAPRIDPSATIAPGAVVSGDVEIGAHTVVLAGAIVTAQGAPVRIGEYCVLMEHAVIRGAGRHPCHIADHVLVGPHSHVTGAAIGRRCLLLQAPPSSTVQSSRNPWSWRSTASFTSQRGVPHRRSCRWPTSRSATPQRSINRPKLPAYTS